MATDKDRERMRSAADQMDRMLGTWEPVTEDDAQDKLWGLPWALLKVFPDGMADYGHWLDELKAVRTTNGIGDVLFGVDRADGGEEPFIAYIDLSNSRIYLIPVNLQFQVVSDFHNDWLSVTTDEAERALFEDASLEAMRRNFIALTFLAKSLDLKPPPFDKCSQVFSQFRPLAFKSPDKKRVALFDCFVTQGSDRVWYDFVWDCLKRVKKIGIEAGKDDPDIRAWADTIPDKKPPNPLKAAKPCPPKKKTSSRSTSQSRAATKRPSSSRTKKTAPKSSTRSSATSKKKAAKRSARGTKRTASR